MFDSIVDAHYGRPEDFAFGIVDRQLDPCREFRVYRVEEEPAHWHYVGLGLSERRNEELELTFRLACASSPGEPPKWPLGLLQNLTRYMVKEGDTFAEGHLLSLNGPIVTERQTEIVVVAFTRDPALGAPFLQVVGLTEDEYQTARRWSVRNVLDLVSVDNALLVTDIARHSVVAGRTDIESAIDAAGSSLAGHHESAFDALEDEHGDTRIFCGAAHVKNLYSALVSRIGRGRDFEVRSKTARVVFSPAAVSAMRWDDGVLRIDVCPALLAELAGVLRPSRGAAQSSVLEGLTIVVEPSVIRDLNGDVISTIG